jgi:hypothetical protein
MKSPNSFCIGLRIGDCFGTYRAIMVFIKFDIDLICCLLCYLALFILLLVFLTMEVNRQDKLP